MKARVVSSAAVLALTSTLGLVSPAVSQDGDNFGKRNTPQSPSVIIAPALQPAPPPVVVQPSPPAVVVPQSSAPVVVQPAPPGTVVVQPPAVAVPATPVQAEDIEANEVRAQTIYANKIRASAVSGTVHKIDKVRLGDGRASLKTPSVVASVIYADEIEADRVIADNIYVRDLERR
jgi:hypothetical protein